MAMHDSTTRQRVSQSRRTQWLMKPTALTTIFTMIVSLFGQSIYLIIPQAARAADTWTVTTLADRLGDSCAPGDCSLREAITYSGGGDTIQFAAGLTGSIVINGDIGEFFVDHDLTIVGSGETALSITGQDSMRIFEIISGANLTISDMTLADGYDDDEGGGAVLVTGGSFSATHVAFRDNYADLAGGAIYNDDQSVTLTDDTFVGNLSSNDGGAVYNNGTSLTVVDTTMSGNLAYGDGGAIYRSSGDVNISGTSTLFSTNSSDNGGAIEDNGEGGRVNVQDATFTANTSIFEGGAIDSESGFVAVTNTAFIGNASNDSGHGGALAINGFAASVVSSTFIGNSVYDGGSGGAIEICSTAGATIDGSLFQGNSAANGDGYGGAIDYECGTNLAIKGTDHQSVFEANTVDQSGGALYLDSMHTDISNTLFKDNVATFNWGGAITQYNDLTLTSSTFIGNVSESDQGAGAINGDASVLTITGSTFNENSAQDGGEAGALYLCEDTTTISTSAFNNNSAELGTAGAIYLDCGDLTVDKSLFNGNSQHDSGAIAAEGSSARITDSTFFQNTTLFGASAIYTGVSTTISNVTFVQNAGGNPLYEEGATVHVANTIFGDLGVTECTEDPGGIVSDGHNIESDDSCGLTATTDATSTDPKTDPRGIQDHGGVTESVALLTGSPAINAADGALCAATDQRGVSRTEDAGCDVGAYESNSDVSIPTPPVGDLTVTTLVDADNGACTEELCSLTDALAHASPDQTIGFAPGLTGIISTAGLGVGQNQKILGPGQNTITLASQGNRILYVYDPTASVDVSGLTFASGQLSGGDNGAAILNEGVLSVEDSTFRDNVANNLGGAIASYGTSLSVKNDLFTDNSGDVGGAIYMGDGNSLLSSSSTFSENYGYEAGGAIGTDAGDATIDGSTFRANAAHFVGGAFYMNADHGTTNITNTSFLANAIDQDAGGAINQNTGTLNVSSSVFNGNVAIQGYEGALYADGSYTDVKDSSLMGNIATNGSGAIGSCSDTSIEGTSFTANHQMQSGNAGALGLFCYDQVSLSHLTFTGNSAYNTAGAVYLDVGRPTTISDSQFTGNLAIYGSGGALYHGSQDLHLTNDTFTDNGLDDANDGGAVYSEGENLMIAGSTFSRNVTGPDQNGGALYVCTQTTTVDQSSFTNNAAKDDAGGAIYNDCSTLVITNSTLQGNTSWEGGALYAAGSTNNQIRNSTFAQNGSTDDGGALLAFFANVELGSDTFAQNDGSHSIESVNSSVVTQNTIFAGGSYGDCGVSGEGGFNSLGHNLVADDSCGFSHAGDIQADPKLDAGGLKNNGGSLLTIALADHSPAIDAGNASCPLTDEIGTTRPQGVACDIGAFESTDATAPVIEEGPATSTVTTLADSDDGTCTTELCSLYDAVTYSGSGTVIRFADGLSGTIKLRREMNIDHDLTIQGPGQKQISISGQDQRRIFNVYDGAVVDISGLTIMNGYDSSDDGGAIYNNGSLGLSHMTFQGNYADGDGGAIANYGPSLSLSDVVLTGNHAEYNGGAVESLGESFTSVSTTYSGNYSSNNGGGAVHIEDGVVAITDSAFNANTSDSGDGGAIKIDDSLSVTVSSTSFTANMVVGYSGGAIDHEAGDFIVASSTFDGNMATDGGSGGAIYADGQTIALTDSTFTGNTALGGGDGGAVLLCEGLNASHDTFTGNASGDGQGGAIEETNCDYDETISDTTFDSNSASDNGGAIKSGGSLFRLSSSIFKNNQSYWGGGGAIDDEGNGMSISDTHFDANVAEEGNDGGAIYADGQSLSITGSSFTNNATVNGGSGGAIYSCEDVTIDQTTFQENTALNNSGGAIWQNCGTVSLTRSLLQGNTAQYGGAIFSNGSDRFSVANSTFFQNVATNIGAAIFSQVDGVFTNDTFSENTGNSAFMIVGATGVIENDIFSNGTENCATGEGGAIFSRGHNLETADTCNLYDDHGDRKNTDAKLDPRGPVNHGGETNTIALLTGSPAIDHGYDASCPLTDQAGTDRPVGAKCDMGAYESTGDLAAPTVDTQDVTVTTLADRDNGECVEDDCSLREAILYSSSTQTIGFARGLTGVLTLGDSSLLLTHDVSIVGPGQNAIVISADNQDEHIFDPDASNLTLSGLTLSNAIYAGEGGAIFTDNNLFVSSSTFRGNYAGDWGGAIETFGDVLSVTSTLFSGNSADENAGAIDAGANNHSIVNSTFVGNFSSSQGGAIFQENGDGLITGATFMANAAYEDAGAFRGQTEGLITIASSTFLGNSSVNDRGGAIADDEGPLNISDTLFSGNHTPEDMAGAILAEMEGPALTVTGTTSFVGNSSSNDGGAVGGCTNMVFDSASFIANTTVNDDGGGAIDSNCGALTVTGYDRPALFKANSSEYRGGAIFLNESDTTNIYNAEFVGNVSAYSKGGAIMQSDANDLNVFDSSFDKNNAEQQGGAVAMNTEAYNQFTRTTFADNASQQEGGAIDNNYSALSLNQATMVRNTSQQGQGGAISNAYQFQIDGSYFANNSAMGDEGGAIHTNGSNSTVQDSTFFQNLADNRGAALVAYNDVTMNNVTLSQNDGAAALEIDGPTLHVRNSIIGDPGACDTQDGGAISSDTHNIDIDGSCGLSSIGDQSSVDPLLNPAGPLDHGSFNLTHDFQEGSTALDQGDGDDPGSGGLSCALYDQRGRSRPQGAACDVGAYEYGTDPSTPGAISGLDGSVGATTLSLSWSDPADNGGAQIMNYRVRYRVHGTEDWLTYHHIPFTDAAFELVGLATSTQYDVEVAPINYAGVGGAVTLTRTTLSEEDHDPPVISEVVATPTTTAVTVTWTTNEDASSHVQYGTTDSYGSSTGELDTDPRVTSHSVTIDGLAACTIYHLSVDSTDGSDNTGTGDDVFVKTTGCGDDMTGNIKVTVTNEAGDALVGTRVDLACDSGEGDMTAYQEIGVTDGDGQIVQNPLLLAGCASGRGLSFKVPDHDGIPLQTVPVIFSFPAFYSDIDPNTTSTYHDNSTNVYQIGISTTGTWAAKFWNGDLDAGEGTLENTDFPTGDPVFETSYTDNLSPYWGEGSPDGSVNTDGFWGEFTKTITLADGWYNLNIASDDGDRVYIDGTRVMNYWYPQGESELHQRLIHVSAGEHVFKVQMFENYGGAGVTFNISPTDAPSPPVLALVTPVPTSLNDRINPTIAFSSTQPGNVTYMGSCTSTTTTVRTGEQTMEFTKMDDGTYNDCAFTVTNPDTGLTSAPLNIPSFTVVAPAHHDISSCEELQAMDSDPESYADDYRLTQNIDCTGVDFQPLGYGWDDDFRGVFDGNHKTISNLRIYQPDSSNVALFIGMNGADVHDLTLSHGSVTGDYDVSGLASYAYDTSLENVSSDLRTVMSGASEFAAGLIGYVVFDDGEAHTWSNVTSTGAVHGYYDVGGVIGYLNVYTGGTSFALDHAFASGDVGDGGDDAEYAGGLIGYADIDGGAGPATTTVTISNARATGAVDAGNGGTAGGFLSEAYVTAGEGGWGNLVITSSTANGDVSGTGDIGGFVGIALPADEGGTATMSILHSSASGNVSSHYYAAGGFVGHAYASAYESGHHVSVTFTDDHARGNVTGDNTVGGFLGATDGEGPGVLLSTGATGGLTIDRSYALGNVTGNINDDDAVYTGGFVGRLSCGGGSEAQLYACSVTRSYASGNVLGNRYVGGFMGFGDVGSTYISDVFASGDTSANLIVGGFVGDLEQEDSLIQHAYSSGQVTGASSPIGSFAGGVGFGDIEKSYATGHVSDGGFGFIGAYDSVSVSDDYFDASTTGSLITSGDEPLEGITAVDIPTDGVGSQPGYFLNTDNVPYSTSPTWDFGGVWLAHEAALPTLRGISFDNLAAPVISDIGSTATTTTATVTWSTDLLSSSKVLYAPNANYASSTGELDEAGVLSHSVELDDLVACTTYHYEVISRSLALVSATSTDQTFTTSGCAGGATVQSQSANTITTSEGGTVSHSEGSANINVQIPAGFTTTTTSVEIQIKALDSGVVLGTVGTPDSFHPVGSTLFDVKALIDSTTLLDSFDVPITITMHYTADDVSGLDTSTLWIYHYHGGEWERLDDCHVDTSAMTVTCTTTGFSSFSLFAHAATVHTHGGGGGGGGGGVTGIPPQAIASATGVRPALDFIINQGAQIVTSTLLNLALNGDPKSVSTYAVSIDAALKNAPRLAYTPTATFGLPAVSGLYNVYLRYFSSTGDASMIISHAITLLLPNTASAPATSTTATAPSSGPVCYMVTFGKDLKAGTTDANVKQLQIFLNGHGAVVAKTGPGSKGHEAMLMGKATAKALMSFQKANGLKADGVFAGKTRALIQSMMTTVACPTPATTSTAPAGAPRDLKVGSVGDDVKQLQIFLNTHGYLVAKTGPGSKGQELTNFGNATKKALMAFQKANKIKADGVYGGKTKALISGMK